MCRWPGLSRASPPNLMGRKHFRLRTRAPFVRDQWAEAELATTWRALHDLDLAQIPTPLMDAAMYVRGLPTR